MKHRGADIRIVNIPKDEAVEIVRNFAASEKLREENEKINDKLAIIRAINPIDSHLKFWWRGIPQIIEWTLIDLGSNTTRIETRFGIQRKFRVWFWSVLIGLVLFFNIAYGLSIYIGNNLIVTPVPEKISALYSFYTVLIIFAVVFLVGSLIFTTPSLETKYGNLISLLSRRLKERNNLIVEKTLQSNYLFPDIFIIPILYLMVLILFLGMHVTSEDITGSDIWKAVVLLVFILVILLLFVFFNAKIKSFMERTVFILIAIQITLPLLILYNLPNVNFWLPPKLESYYKFTDIEKNNGDQSLRENSRIKKNILEVITNVLLLRIIIYAGILCIFTYPLIIASRLVSQIKEYIKNYFIAASTGSIFQSALDFRGFSKKFSFLVFFFWIIVSVGIYWGTYTTLSVFTFNVLGVGLPFVADVSEKFCNDINFIFYFFLKPHIPARISITFSKVIIFIYTLPLFWILFKIGEKKINTYLDNIKEFRSNWLRVDNDRKNLLELCNDIALANKVQPPNIIVIPSIVPKMETKYIGFPYFKSYILITEGCLKFTDYEIAGLLAHEIHHIKYHSFKWRLLNLMSDYTLFGNGFLAVITNSYLKELEADERAIRWLQKQKMPLSNFVNALQIMAVSATLDEIEVTSPRGGSRKEKDIRVCFKWIKLFFGRLRNNANTVVEIYFGNQILSYIHPTLEDRIKRIQVMVNSS